MSIILAVLKIKCTMHVKRTVLFMKSIKTVIFFLLYPQQAPPPDSKLRRGRSSPRISIYLPNITNKKKYKFCDSSPSLLSQ